MRRLAIGALLLALVGCASDGGGNTGGNLAEASRLNTQLGADYYQRGQIDLAQDKLERALEQDGHNAQAHAIYALVLQRKGDLRNAEAHFRRALSIDSDNPELRNNFGVFLCSQGKAADAERYFMEAVQDKNYTTPEAAWTNAGLCAKPYDVDRAERDFRQALAIKPDLPEALAQMAWISFRNKDYLHARAFIQRLDAVARPNAEVLWIAARTERELGDEIAAYKYEARLRRDYPDSPEAKSVPKSSEP